MKTLILLLTLLLGDYVTAQEVPRKCQISNSQGTPLSGINDPLFQTITALTQCPNNVFELKLALLNKGYKVSPSMVANRGRNNPNLGSFSLFEMVTGTSVSSPFSLKPGDFFFGHFTHSQSGIVHLDQAPREGKLMIELIVWDFDKQNYNFYELIGTNTSAQWFYRGDSKDALFDNQALKLQNNPLKPEFGGRMRCSGCHTSGGPIMKEITLPHNDWATVERPLLFSPNTISEKLKQWTKNQVSANDFAKAVSNGINQLEDSPLFKNFKSNLTLKKRLKPLFCTTEINLESSADTLESPSTSFQISSTSLVNPLLATTSLEIDKKYYITQLKNNNFLFPETSDFDSDHPWLAPVKGTSNQLAISTLIQDKVITEEFAMDVLAIDYKHPLFSQTRCELLKLVPEVTTELWENEFLKKLKLSQLHGAPTLVTHLTDPQKNKTAHQEHASAHLSSIKELLTSQTGVSQAMDDLQILRLSVFKDEISKNPRGQILEPGFRVIFPVQTK